MRKSTHITETLREIPHVLKDAVAKGEAEFHELTHWAEQECAVLGAWMVSHIKPVADQTQMAWQIWQHRFDMNENTSVSHEGEFCCLECGSKARFEAHAKQAKDHCPACHAAVLEKRQTHH